AKRPDIHRPQRSRQRQAGPLPETGTANANGPDIYRSAKSRQNEARPLAEIAGALPGTVTTNPHYLTRRRPAGRTPSHRAPPLAARIDTVGAGREAGPPFLLSSVARCSG